MERIQAAIVYDCICQITKGDGPLQDVVNLAIVQAVHPNLYLMFAGQNSIPVMLNKKVLFTQICKVLKERTIKMLESLKGSEIPVNISTNQLFQEIDSHSKQVSLNLVEVLSVKRSIKSSISVLNNVVQKYQMYIDKYSQEYLIPIKLNSDILRANQLLFQSKEIVFLNRLNNVRRTYEKIGSVGEIGELKEKRKSLEEKSTDLSTRITEAKSQLNKYGKCDNNLLREYIKVKERLDEQKWAKSLLGHNFSNLSFSD